MNLLIPGGVRLRARFTFSEKCETRKRSKSLRDADSIPAVSECFVSGSKLSFAAARISNVINTTKSNHSDENDAEVRTESVKAQSVGGILAREEEPLLGNNLGGEQEAEEGSGVMGVSGKGVVTGSTRRSSMSSASRVISISSGAIGGNGSNTNGAGLTVNNDSGNEGRSSASSSFAKSDISNATIGAQYNPFSKVSSQLVS
jgi:hypothetical protein